MRIINLLGLFLSIGLLSACVSYPGALYVEGVQLGLDVSVSTTDTRPLNINMGYDQAIFAIAPKMKQGDEAVSLLSKSDILMQFTQETVINNIFVSGDAARDITKHEETMHALFQVCDVTPAFATKKLTIEQSLIGIKGDNDKVKKLYKVIFPNGKEGGDLDVTADMQKEFQFQRLMVRLGAICDPEGELAVFNAYQTNL